MGRRALPVEVVSPCFLLVLLRCCLICVGFAWFSCILYFLYSVFPVFCISCIPVFLYSCIPVFCILYFLYSVFRTPRKTAPGSWRAAPVPMLLRLETARPKASGGTPLEQVEWLDAARSGVV